MHALWIMGLTLLTIVLLWAVISDVMDRFWY